MLRKSKPSASATLPPNFPQHNLSEPFARLQTLGESEELQPYLDLSAQLKRGDAVAAAERLVQIILDETYYDYYSLYKTPEECESVDSRIYTPLHALRTLAHMGEAATVGIEPLLYLLDTDDDYLHEEIPYYYGAVGAPAIAALQGVLLNTAEEGERRWSAATALQEIGVAHEDRYAEIVASLQGTLSQEDDPEVAAFLVVALLDLGAEEAVPTIEKAFEEDRIDEFIVDLTHVQEHFGLPITASPPQRVPLGDMDSWEGAMFSDDFAPPAPNPIAAGDPHTPYVAPAKVGRNEPCPCGSGKKYKKCCGA